MNDVCSTVFIFNKFDDKFVECSLGVNDEVDRRQTNRFVMSKTKRLAIEVWLTSFSVVKTIICIDYFGGTF